MTRPFLFPSCAVRRYCVRYGTPEWNLTPFRPLVLSPHGVPNELNILPDRMLAVPDAPELRPHPTYLRWHRENCFKA